MQDGSDNLNSLIDIMSCVAGILVIVLAVSVVEVGSIGSVEVEAVTAAQRELRRVTELRSTLGKRWQEDEAQALQANRQELARLLHGTSETRRQLESSASALEQAEGGIEQSVKERRQQVATLERLVGEAQEELERALAARVPPTLERPATSTVRLPDPRPAPPDSEAVVFLCRFGRVLAEDEMWDQLVVGVRDALGWNGPIPVSTLAGQVKKVQQYFNRNVVGNNDLRWRMVIDSPLLFAVLEWRRQEAGETLAQIAAADSHFRERITAIDPRSHYVQFVVWSDSFESYLRARKITEEAGLGAGWIVYDFEEEVRLNLFAEGGSAPNPLD